MAQFLFLSVETDGVGPFFSQNLVRVAMVLTDDTFQTLALESFFVQGATQLKYNPNLYTLEQVNNGLKPEDAAALVAGRLQEADVVVAHNLDFVASVLMQLGSSISFENKKLYCTMEETRDLCHLMPIVHGEYKYPKLEELYKHLHPEDSEVIGTKAEEKAWAIKQCFEKLNI